MPELPEAETIARGLRAAIAGQIIREVEVVRPDLVRPGPGEFRDETVGRRILDVHRRAKKVVIPLERDALLLISLGMSGRVLLGSGEAGHAGSGNGDSGEAIATLSRHPGVILTLADNRRVVYDDARRFGSVELLSRAEWLRRSRAIGPEPLAPSYTARRLREALAGSIVPIRNRLLDQRRIAGIGNIYAVEGLWHARIHPLRPAGSLSLTETAALHRAIRAVLRRAIEAGGTTLRDHRGSHGEWGSFAIQLQAYGREGAPCPRCGTPIRRGISSNRSFFHCPRCQPEEIGRFSRRGD